jgi:predicted nucleotidyltransferase component of viral defense system
MPELADTRLVGGTALAFHLGHRLSIDLDLFGKFDPELITEALAAEGFDDFSILSENEVVKHYIINQVKVDVVKYERYPWLESSVNEGSLRIASLKDIAAMKVAATTNRGTKKDFIDIFFLLRTFSIKEILDLYQRKYFDANMMSAIYSLAFFDDAEKDELPMMLIPANWEEVKKRIAAEVLTL